MDNKPIHLIGLAVVIALVGWLAVRGFEQLSFSFNTNYAKEARDSFNPLSSNKGGFNPYYTTPAPQVTSDWWQFLSGSGKDGRGGGGTVYSPTPAPTPIQTTPTPSMESTVSCSLFNGASNLKYFGFYAGSHQSIIAHPSALDEQKGFTNASILFGYDMNFIGNELDKAHRNGQKILINLVRNGLVLDGYGNWLDSDWAEFANNLQPYYNRGDILGFYIADDYWTMGGNAAGYSLNEINRIIALIKQRFPGVITAGILQNSNQVAPFNPNVDWVGVEVYPREGFTTMAVDSTDIDRLAELLRPNQKIILIPNVTINWEYGSGSMSNYYQQDQWNKAIWPVLQKAANNPKIAAIFPYIWQNTSSTHLGASSIPLYVQNFKTLGGCPRFR